VELQKGKEKKKKRTQNPKIPKRKPRKLPDDNKVEHLPHLIAKCVHMNTKTESTDMRSQT
jgi:hypothetical protein